MKKIITVVLLFSGITVSAQVKKVVVIDTVKIVTVQAGKTVMRLTKADVKYIESVFKSNPKSQSWLVANLKPGTLIKNNDTADMLIAIMKGRK